MGASSFLLLVFTRSTHSGTFILPDFLRKAARAMVNSCWLTSFTETDGIFSLVEVNQAIKAWSFSMPWLWPLALTRSQSCPNSLVSLARLYIQRTTTTVCHSQASGCWPWVQARAARTWLLP